GTSLTLIATLDLTIKRLKLSIERITGRSLIDKFLVFRGTILRDSESLEALGIRNLDIIHCCNNLLPVSLRKPVKITVFVKMEDKKELPVIVDNCVKGEEFEKLIKSAVGYSKNEYYLVFMGKTLKLDCSLAENGVNEFSDVELKLKSNGKVD
ncbi:hypothetical protein CONCODRAFT_2845, partial [Conidiobolus coronatus NRRL 28638]